MPDEQATSAVLAGGADYHSMLRDDAIWVIVELEERGYTAAQIADWLHITPRHVKRLKSSHMAGVMAAYHRAIAERDHLARRVKSLTAALEYERGK